MHPSAYITKTLYTQEIKGSQKPSGGAEPERSPRFNVSPGSPFVPYGSDSTSQVS